MCGICNEMLTDKVHCGSCNLDLHYDCGGITEIGYRKLGEERKMSWRCHRCKNSQRLPLPVAAAATPPDCSIASLLREIRELTARLTPLESVPEDVKAIRSDIDMLKTSFNEVNIVLSELSERIKKNEARLTRLEGLGKDQGKVISAVQVQLETINNDLNEREQFARLKNIELKGLPQMKNENLLDLVCSIGKKIQYPILKSQIDFATRVQSRDPDQTKPIVVCFINRYVKEDFVAAARVYSKTSPLMSSDIGLEAKNSRIFVNDHLTLRNKALLSKVKKTAKERGFQYVWVKYCKLFVRRDDTSPILNMKSEKDISKMI